MSRRTETAYKAQSLGESAQHDKTPGSEDRVNAAVVQRKFTLLSGEICLACGPLDSAYHGNMFGDQAEVSRGHSRCGHRQRRSDDWKRAVTRRSGGYHGGLTPLKGQTRRTAAYPMSSGMQ